MSTPHHRVARLVTSLLLVGVVSACAGTEQDPLSANTGNGSQPDRTTSAPSSSSATPSLLASEAAPEPSSSAGAGAGAGASTGTAGQEGTGSFITADLGDDPLNIRADGATLCGVQPKDSFLQYTIMLHNPTLATFTFDSIELSNAQGLQKVDAKVTPANREGHGNHGAAPTPAAGHGTASHDAAPTPSSTPSPTPSEPSTFSVEPVPAVGYLLDPDKHINITVSVALDDAAARGTADDVLVGFSTEGRQFSVPHDLNITIDRTTCS